MDGNMVVTQQQIVQSLEQASEYVPMRILEVELGEPLPTIAAFDDKKESYYQRAHCLVRLHTEPLGLVELKIDKDELSPDEYASEIWLLLHEQVNEHLRHDGLPLATSLTAAGLPSLLAPKCIEERESFLQTAPFVSIIVATRDRTEYLARCLRALMALHYPAYEVIVVDNAPTTTATADFIQQAYSDEPRLKYVHENRPGVSLAFNCGIMTARGEIIAFTADDVIVDTYWLVGLVKGFRVAEHVACVTGLILPMELETPAQFLFEAYGGFTRGFVRRVFDLKENHPKLPLHPYIAGRFGTGASSAFTTAFLRSECGFDPALGPGTRTGAGEDLDAFFRVIMGQHRLVYEPTSLLYHLHRSDNAHLQKQIYYYGAGFTAYLTKCLLDNPRLVFDFIGKFLCGLFFLLKSRQPKQKGKTTSYPKELTLTERKGMLYGPFAYIRSRWEVRKLSRNLTLDEAPTVVPAWKEQLGL